MLLEALFALGTIVLTEYRQEIVAGVKYIAKRVEQWINANHHSRVSASTSCEPKGSKDVLRKIEEIDVEVFDLEKKEARDGKLSRSEQEKKEELEFEKQKNFKDFQELKRQEVLDQKLQDLDNHQMSTLDNDRVHILQYHMGQVVFDKQCSCGRPMILNSKRRTDGTLYQLSDFFWSCTGYYKSQCKKTISFTPKDSGLLHNANIFEFQVSNQDLSSIFHNQKVTKMVIDRVKDHEFEQDDEILCPIHHIPMILKEKKEPENALDMFYYACPHYDYNYPIYSCGQKVKLKSPPQLAALLNRKEGRGII